jgi:hypothetical protein
LLLLLVVVVGGGGGALRSSKHCSPFSSLFSPPVDDPLREW